jgi:hypothetical protein
VARCSASLTLRRFRGGAAKQGSGDQQRMVIEGAHNLLRRGEVVPGVQPQDVDVVGAQPSQGGFQRGDQALAVVAAGIQVTVTQVQRVLGADNEVVAVGSQQFAEDRLGGAVGVFIRDVDQCSACLGEQFELLGSLGLGRASLTRRPELPSNV